jgi:hypothetical protein
VIVSVKPGPLGDRAMDIPEWRTPCRRGQR